MPNLYAPEPRSAERTFRSTYPDTRPHFDASGDEIQDEVEAASVDVIIEPEEYED